MKARAKITLAATALGGIGLALCAASIGAVKAQDANKPAGLDPFNANCSSCHTIGGGPRVGPDLKGVMDRVPKPGREWVMNFIKNPGAANDPYAKDLKSKYPLVMPGVAHLGDPMLKDIVDFVAGGGPGLVTTSVRAGDDKDAALGHQLFTGEKRIASGAPPCISCHSVAGLDQFGGGTLAKDLTKAIDRNGGRQGLAAALTNPQFIVMRDVFAKTPLNENEVVALTAFLEQASLKPEQAPLNTRFIGLSIVGAIVALGFAHFIWRGRFNRVRRDIIEETYSGGEK